MSENKILVKRLISQSLLILITICTCALIWFTPSALAELNDDKFDGNIFALYAGNGALIPPKVTLAESLQRKKTALLLLYVEDSSDCKKYAPVISQLQSLYGQGVDFIPINVDAIPVKNKYESTEPGYYYQGYVPQTVIIDEEGKAIFNEKGKIALETIDDLLRKKFNLPPRSLTKELKERALNEINTELTP